MRSMKKREIILQNSKKLFMNGWRFSTNKPTFKSSDEKAIESAEFTQIHSSTFIISL